MVLEPLGVKLVRADPVERKALWRQQLLRLGLFRRVADALGRQSDRTIDADFVLETIAITTPFEDYRRVFAVFVSWSRYGDLFAYDEDSETISSQ